MSKYRANTVLTPIDQAAETGVRPIDPLRLLWTVTAIALAIGIASFHVWPQAAYPARAVVPSVLLIVLTAAALLIVWRAQALTARALWPVALPAVFLLWAWQRTAAARVPTEGTPLLGTALEGMLIFAVALVLSAAARDWRMLRIYEGRDDAQVPALPDRPRVIIDILLVSLLVLGFGLALWAVYQYFIQFEQQLNAFYRQLTAAGQSLTNLPPHEYQILQMLQSKRIGSTFGNSNVLAGILSMLAPPAVAAAFKWPDRAAKGFAVVVLGFIWYVTILTTSRGGMLTLVIATAAAVVFLAWGQWHKRAALLGVIAAVCIMLAALAILTANHAARQRRPGEIPAETVSAKPRYTFFQRVFGSPTIAQRLYYWESAADMIRAAPLLGHGFGGYAVLYPKYRRPPAGEARHPHNIALQLWVETGFIGLLLWLAWVGVVLARPILYLRRGGNGGAMELGVKALWLAAVAFLLNNLFEMTWTFREAYLDWCLVMGALAGLSWERAVAHEPAAGAAWDRPAGLAALAVPALLGAVMAWPVLFRPMFAELNQVAASDLIQGYGLTPETAGEVEGFALKMVHFEPRNPRYHDFLASLYRDLATVNPAQRDSYLNRAREEFETAARLNPDSASIRADLGLLEQSLKQTARARAHLTEAARLYPLNARYDYLLAALEKDAGDRPAAERHIRAAIDKARDERERNSYLQFQKDLTTGTLTRK